MEVLGGIVAIILLLWACSGSSSGKKQPEYRIEKTQDERYWEVIDRNGESRYIGTYEACELWITRHTSQ